MRIRFQSFLFSLLILLMTGSIAEARGPLPGVDSSSKFLIYYGQDFSQENIDYLKTFDVLVLDPGNGVGLTPRMVQELQDAGVSYVLAYISIGEDAPGPGETAITHQGKGPVYQDGTNLFLTEQNAGIASFYVDSVYDHVSGTYQHDGIADTNGIFGGYFILPTSDWRWVLNEMRIGGSPGIFTQRTKRPGLKQIAGARDPADLDSRTADFGFDGFFLDTIDTAGPYSAEGWYPWTAKAMQETVKFISDTYTDKTVLANRGSFFFMGGLTNNYYGVTPIDYNIRPYINAMLFESYMLDSDITNPAESPYFIDNKYNVVPKLMSEANRNDGFTVMGMDYMMNRSALLYDEMFDETIKQNGWVQYLSAFRSIDTLDNLADIKVSDPVFMLDTAAPEWVNTSTGPSQIGEARVGVSSLAAGANAGELTVFWDSAKDQSWPVHYNIYTATQPDFSDQVKHATVDFQKNAGWDNNPVQNVANKFTLTGLSDGIYYVRVRAEDSSEAANEDTNTTTLSIDLSDQVISNPLTIQVITINGLIDDWAGLESFGSDPADVDVGGVVNLIDWKTAWMAHDSDTLYLAHEYHAPLAMNWGHNIYLDTDTEKATGFAGSGSNLPVGADYLIQSYNLYQYTGTGENWSWMYFGQIERAWTQFSSEMYLPTAWLGSPTAINFFYEGSNSAVGIPVTDYFPDAVLSEGKYFHYSLE
uniref:Fibronectin type-III domain-containing protein n=1 Tax=uncultured Thiotrichaceae bacterium TaxID=298394 RepID=A0A6S6SYN0_9GAMM|nr:MAG: Unknown protein [uncultured Thiotrichaceae bacterium]